jgi:hypothetical protein
MKRKYETRQRPTTATDPAPVIYHDALLRVLLVVEHGGQLWLVPRRPGGWSARSKVTIPPEARQQRLTPARDVTAGWLGIDAQEQRETSTETNANGEP